MTGKLNPCRRNIKDQMIKASSWNVNGVKTDQLDLATGFMEVKPDVLVLTETKARVETGEEVAMPRGQVENIPPVRYEYAGSCRGGVALVIRAGVEYNILKCTRMEGEGAERHGWSK